MGIPNRFCHQSIPVGRKGVCFGESKFLPTLELEEKGRVAALRSGATSPAG